MYIVALTVMPFVIKYFCTPSWVEIGAQTQRRMTTVIHCMAARAQLQNIQQVRNIDAIIALACGMCCPRLACVLLMILFYFNSY